MQTKSKWKIARSLVKQAKKRTIPLEEWLSYDLGVLKKVYIIRNKSLGEV